MKRLGIAMLAGLALLATSSMAAEAPPSAHQLELARRLFTGMNMAQMMDGVTKSMSASMLTNLRNSNPALSEDQARAISEAVAESTRDLMPKVVDRMVPVYASVFSEKELTDAVAFYDSPSGKAILAKMPSVMGQMGPIMQELTPQMMTDVRRRICAKTDCTKLGPAAPKS